MMASRQLISVILPVYNCEKYIARAIQSVINQSYENWELIVVNDGSKDSSEKIAMSYIDKDERIRVISQENQGVSAARNHGMEKANGEILMFLDADDWFLEETLETVIHYWDESLDMILFDYYDVSDKEKRTYKKLYPEDRREFGENKRYPIDEIELSIAKYYREKHIIVYGGPCGRAFRTEYLKERNIKFPTDIYAWEDHIFNMDAIMGMDYVLYVSEPIYCYYINAESTTYAMYQKNGERLLENIRKRNEYAKEIFKRGKSKIYKKAYYRYLFHGFKVILWWIANEKDSVKKQKGRDYCYEQAVIISRNLDENYSVAERILLMLCRKKCFIVVEGVIALRKRIKYVFRIR